MSVQGRPLLTSTSHLYRRRKTRIWSPPHDDNSEYATEVLELAWVPALVARLAQVPVQTSEDTAELTLMSA
ncbi:hypothetical protein P3T76_006646 [Phytophthora citrophthora]|uniref:Uncharacterized protein n=1 Tax=Phytophthora citrophthora TaxID=4793 RepID=A0AAD9LPN9_9STRA|nr:hypothetical protein P3T76_006646 [Phytophthora citrophthora]